MQSAGAYVTCCSGQGLPTQMPRIGAARVFELMQMDKKVLAGNVRLVLLERLGQAVFTAKYAREDLDTVLAEHFG